MSADDFHTFVSEAELALQSTYATQLAQHNNAGSSNIWSHAEFDLTAMPIQRAQFISSGTLTLTIELPGGSNYYGVTLTDLRVFLVGLSEAANEPVD